MEESQGSAPPALWYCPLVSEFLCPTRGSCGTLSQITSTSCSTGESSPPAARSSPRSSKTRVTTGSGRSLAPPPKEGGENARRSDYPRARARRIQVRFQRSGGVLLQDTAQGYRRGDCDHDLRAQKRARVDARVPPQRPQVFPGEAGPTVGRQPQRARLRRHLLLHTSDGEPGTLLGRRAGRHQEHLR